MTPISNHQRATLRYLMDQRRTVVEIKSAVGLKSGLQSMLASLHQQGMIRYVGGAGVKLGKGWWELTARGRTIANESERT